MTRVKICGLTSFEDARLAAAAGADLLGFIFFRGSPRYVAPEVVRTIVDGVKQAQPDILCIGVFVDEPESQVRERLDLCLLDAAQLHGSEPPEMLASLSHAAYKAIRPRSVAEVRTALIQYSRRECHELLPDLLLDSYDPMLPGGTGKVADWSLAAEVAARRKVLLAGGLSPANVARAVRKVRPWGVDVSTGVEASAGRKSPDAVRAFVEAVRHSSRIEEQ